jgi:hypothetical protein
MSQPPYPPPAPQGRPHYPPSSPQRRPQPRHGQQYPPPPARGHTPAGETSRRYAEPPAPAAAPRDGRVPRHGSPQTTARYEQQAPVLQQQAYAAPPAPRNGLGLAAVIVAPVGILFGLVPLTGFIAVICALVAIPLALVGWSRVRKGAATNGKTTIAGLVLGVVALALGIWGITIVFGAVGQLADDLSGPAPVGAPAVPGQQPAVDGSAAQTTAVFGERVTFDDGVVVEVAAPQPYRPGRFAVGHDGDRAVKIDITVTNGSDEPLDAVTVMTRAMHSGRQVSPIYDSANGGTENPSGTILPGKSLTFSVALSLAKDSAELQVEVQPGFLGEPAIFTGMV